MPSTPRGTRTHRAARARAAAAAALIAGGLTGCSGGTAQDVAATVTRYDRALRSATPGDACALLAERTRSELESTTGESCAAVAGDQLAPQPAGWSVQVFGDQALARTGKQATFLAQFPDGWRVTAVGCSATGDHGRFDCDVQGG